MESHPQRSVSEIPQRSETGPAKAAPGCNVGRTDRCSVVQLPDLGLWRWLSQFHVVLDVTRASGIAARRAGMNSPMACGGRGSDLAVVAKIDHRVGEGLERVVQSADALEAQQ